MKTHRHSRLHRLDRPPVLDVVESLPDRFHIVALAAGANLEELTGQIARHRPQLVSVADADAPPNFAIVCAKLDMPASGNSVGQQGMLAVATHPEASVVVSAAVGVVGLEATYAAVRRGQAGSALE